MSNLVLGGSKTLADLTVGYDNLSRRHGIKTFILPALNASDLTELPPEVRDTMRFVPVTTLEEALKVSLPQPS